jgi:hypothetical protein
VALEPSTVYFLLIFHATPAAGGGSLVPYCFYWTTGSTFPANLHSVSGTVTGGATTVTPDNALVGLGATPFNGNDPAFVGGAVTDGLGQFTIPYVPDGTWYPLAAKDADLDGEINPTMGDPIAFGDSVVVNGADVTGFTMHFQTLDNIHFEEARDAITAKAAEVLPPTRELREFMAWMVDSTGAAREFVGVYTVPGSQTVTEIWMEPFGVNWDTTSGWNKWGQMPRPYTDLASAAVLDSIVARAENMGGREFRRQPPPAGSRLVMYARLGALHNTEFGWLVSDTSKNYWGLQYTFQVDVTEDSGYSLAMKVFLADATTGQILSATGVDDRANSFVPLSPALMQNYPNPFNPSTTIGYELPARSHVELTIHNTLGQLVKQLVSGEVEAGYHESVFDATGLSSGAYFYRLRTGSTVLTNRMLLVR